jgi:hypothetical protein
MKTDLDALGLAAFAATTFAAALVVPDLSLSLVGQPVFSAVIASAIVLTLVTVLRARGRRGSRLERLFLALFLSLMPTVYLMSWLRFGGGGGWLGSELAGQVVFGALAIAGLRRSPWFLAIGIAGHGILWDAWHYGRTPFMPDWYAIFCAVVDVGLAIYVATQVPAWQKISKGAPPTS